MEVNSQDRFLGFNMNLIFMDLDGTLLNDEKVISQNTANYLRKRSELGDKLIISSGRSYFSAKDAVSQIVDIVEYFSLQNGAVIYDKNGNIVFEDRLENSEVKRLYNIIKDNKAVDIVYFDELQTYSFGYPDVARRFFGFDNYEIGFTPIDEFEEDVYKIIILGDNRDLLKVKEEIDKLGFNTCFSCDTYLEVNKKGVSKGSAVSKLVFEFDYQNVFVFGDNGNDLEMLKLDFVTVAMKNGTDEVKKAAKYISDYTNDEDGIVHFIKKYLND